MDYITSLLSFLPYFIALLLALLLSTAPIVVHEGEVVIVERLGRFSRILHPGMHFSLRFIDSAKTVKWSYTEEYADGSKEKKMFSNSRIPFRKEIIFDPASTACMTLDKVRVYPNIVVFYKIVDPQKCVYGIEDLYQAIQSVIDTTLQHCISVISLDILMQNTLKVTSSLAEKLKEVETYGVIITKVEIQDLGLPKAIVDATERLITQEKEAEAKIKTEKAQREANLYKQESDRLLQIAKMKTEKEWHDHQTELRYQEGATEARIKTEKERHTAESRAFAVRSLADAEAYSANQMFLRCPEKEADYHLAKLYTQAWKDMQSNAKTLVVPYEAAKFLGGMQAMSVINTVQKD